MKFINSFLILMLLLSCNQAREKQNETSSDAIQESQEIQNGEYPEAIENEEESFLNRSNDSEDFEILEVKEFNKFLASEKPYSKVEVMLLFYPGEIEPPKDDEEVDIHEEILENGNTLITLIHYNLENNSIMGYKYLLELKKNNDRWMMVSAKRNWRYYEGKGDTEWGIEKTANFEQTGTDNETPESENFKYLVSGYFNMHLETRTDELSSKDVMRLFIPEEEEERSEGNEVETIQEKVLANGNTLVTLTRDNLIDDSMKAEQYLMELERIESKWSVVYVKTNWKCREGRGHTDWGIELCL